MDLGQLEEKHLWKQLTVFLSAVFIAINICIFIPAASQSVSAASSEMKIYAIDIGWQTYGDATFLVSNGKGLLMDTGDKDPNRTLMNWLENNNLQSFDMYLSHYHDDHDYYMAEILRTYRIGTLYLPVNGYMSRGKSAYMDFHRNLMNQTIKAAKERGTKIVWLEKGSTFTVGSVQAEVLWGCEYDDGIYDTEYINNNSLLTRFTGGGVSFLTGGDLEEPAEQAILNAGIDISADLFKMNHHGGNTSNSGAFVKKVNPSFAWLNSDEENKWADGWQSWPVNNICNTANTFGTRYNGTITFTCKNGWITADASRHMMTIYEKVTAKGGTNPAVWKYRLNTAGQIHMRDKCIPTSAYSFNQCSSSGGSFPGTWIRSGNTWWYKAPDGSWAGDTWIYDKGWYFLNSKGYVCQGWRQVDGSWYYFHPTTGLMYANRWACISGKWYFLDKSGIMKTGWACIGGKWYYFGNDGAMRTGWVYDNGQWYYLAKDGAMKKGWIFVNSKWYFLAQNGAMQTGWITDKGNRYYLAPDGAMQTGWLTDADQKYYLNLKWGQVMTGLQSIDNELYYLDPDDRGAALVNAFRKAENGLLYYFGEEGKAHAGWLEIDGKKYYAASPSHEILTGPQEIEGISYVFDENGALVETDSSSQEENMPAADIRIPEEDPVASEETTAAPPENEDREEETVSTENNESELPAQEIPEEQKTEEQNTESGGETEESVQEEKR